MHVASISIVVVVFGVIACSGGGVIAPGVPKADDRSAQAPAHPLPLHKNKPESPEPSQSPTPAPSSAPTAGPVPPEASDSLDASMVGFSTALAQKDVERFLEYFSRSKPFRYIGTIEVEPRTKLVHYDDLARGLPARDVDRGWYSILFDGGPDDSLALTVADPERRAWKRVGERKFVLPDDHADSTLFVVWRKEQERWVVDAIGYPRA